MASIDTFRQQHQELMQLTREVVPLLDAERLARECTEARLKLSTWARKLRVHLTLEERTLYPRLMTHDDPQVVKKATRVQQEMSTLSDQLTVYCRDWLAEESMIREGPVTFVEQTKAMFDQMTKRFHFEHDLYLLADGAGAAPARESIPAPSGAAR
jgi:hypothetical protein